MVNSTLTLCYRICRSSDLNRATLCEGGNGSLATVTYLVRQTGITYMVDKALALLCECVTLYAMYVVTHVSR